MSERLPISCRPIVTIVALSLLLGGHPFTREASGAAPSTSTKRLGTFSGPVRAEWLDEDNRKMRLLSNFSYTEPTGRSWLAPKGSIVDGASIPQFFWTTIGGPFEGPYRKASVVHDVACQTRRAPWRDVHRMFYFAMLAGGVGETKAKVMFAAVYHFGPRWTDAGVALGPPKVSGCEHGNCEIAINPVARIVQDEAWSALTKRIEAGEIPLDGIENYSFPEPQWVQPTDPEMLKKLRGLVNQ